MKKELNPREESLIVIMINRKDDSPMEIGAELWKQKVH